MKIHMLVFANPANVGKITKSNISLMKRSAAKLGHKLVIIYDYDCQMKFDQKPELLINNCKIEDINVVIVKANPSGQVLGFRSAFIKQIEMMGIPVVNSELAVMRAKNKIRTLQILSKKNVPIPKSYIVTHAGDIDKVIQDIGFFPVILKTSSGSHGKGVIIVESRRNLQSVIEYMTKESASDPVVIQEYVRESKGRDVRVFIVGRKIIGAMERIATKKGEFRSNFHLGGRVKIADLSEEEKKIAFAAVDACKLEVAGVDIVRSKTGPKVLEVNSNPGLEGITLATGKDIAGSIIKYAVKKAKNYIKRREQGNVVVIKD